MDREDRAEATVKKGQASASVSVDISPAGTHTSTTFNHTEHPLCDRKYCFCALLRFSQLKSFAQGAQPVSGSARIGTNVLMLSPALGAGRTNSAQTAS